MNPSRYVGHWGEGQWDQQLSPNPGMSSSEPTQYDPAKATLRKHRGQSLD